MCPHLFLPVGQLFRALKATCLCSLFYLLFPSGDAAEARFSLQFRCGITPRACAKPPCFPPDAVVARSIVLLSSLLLSLLQQKPPLFSFIYFPLSVNQQGLKQRDPALLVRIIGLIYESKMQRGSLAPPFPTWAWVPAPCCLPGLSNLCFVPHSYNARDIQQKAFFPSCGVPRKLFIPR